MSSLAGYLRELAERGTYDQNDILWKYKAWVKDDKYIVLAHEREPWLSSPGEWEYKAVKCAKRGNDVYASRVESRLKGGGRNVPDILHNFREKPFTSMLL